MLCQLLAITPNAEQVIETAGRTCYQSNDKANPETAGILIQKLIKSGHDSVLEHASATFRISGVSRALTHQLVRHRLYSFSQQSQRYVNEKQFDYVIPPSVYELNEKKLSLMNYADEFRRDMESIQIMYEKWKHYGLKNEDARFVLPNACCSEIVVSANFREWRRIFSVRCDKHAQWEIRIMAMDLLGKISQLAPNVFTDQVETFLTIDNVQWAEKMQKLPWYEEMQKE
jgi:thymidylate synthase (FAD)